MTFDELSGLIEKIADRLVGMSYDDLSTAERQITNLLIANQYLIINEAEDWKPVERVKVMTFGELPVGAKFVFLHYGNLKTCVKLSNDSMYDNWGAYREDPPNTNFGNGYLTQCSEKVVPGER